MQTDPIRSQEKTITTAIVVLLMSLCLCAEAGSQQRGRRRGVGSPVPISFLFFFLSGGVAELSGGSPQRPPSLPLLQNKRGFFSEEHSDVGGGCECGPCVRVAAAAVSASPPQLWCLCKPTFSSLNLHTITTYLFRHALMLVRSLKA